MKAAGPMVAATVTIVALLQAVRAEAADGDALGEVIVTASRQIAASTPYAASEGTITQEDLANRPLLRPADVLESVPGLVVTQHSGDGKANQYFLRGFNVDHGTDFATSVDGVPVNMPTHAHGQGYSDLNFLIPELVERIEYRKGVYHADDGDFSAAGAADIHYRSRVDDFFVTIAAGDEGYRRILAATSTPLASGELLLGGEYGLTEGPWVVPEGYQHVTGLIKLSGGEERLGYSFAVSGYDAHWHATDQIPQRAVTAGLISRFGNVDPTDVGRTHRWSVSGEVWGPMGTGSWRLQTYLLDYHLDLFSNFTYFTDSMHGDQIEQYDNRQVYGAKVSYTLPVTLFGQDSLVRAGLQARDDHIDPVALYDTTDRTRWNTVSVTEAWIRSAGAYVAWELRPARWLRMELGARLDSQHFETRANLPANSGSADEALGSPKLTLALGPWTNTEFFLDFGQGFHSNDARGTTLRVDPGDGLTPVDKVTPMVRATGAELGMRSALTPDLELSAALWALRLDSELVLDNDANTTVPSGATRRYGLEFSAAWHPQFWARIDVDLACTHARFIDFSAAGRYLPNAPAEIGALGLEVDRPHGWFGGAHLRYFGATPLTQDDGVRSRPSLQLDAEAGYHFNPAFVATISVFNLLDRRDDDIEYFYASQLRGEATPVNDIHFHPMAPRSVRVSVSFRL